MRRHYRPSRAAVITSAANPNVGKNVRRLGTLTPRRGGTGRQHSHRWGESGSPFKRPAPTVWPSGPTPRYLPNRNLKSYLYEDLKRTFIAALFIIAKKREHPDFQQIP